MKAIEPNSESIAFYYSIFIVMVWLENWRKVWLSKTLPCLDDIDDEYFYSSTASVKHKMLSYDQHVIMTCRDRNDERLLLRAWQSLSVV